MSLARRFSHKQLSIWVLLLLILGALSGPQGARAQGRQVAFEDHTDGVYSTVAFDVRLPASFFARRLSSR
jgi:hypothetical protein